MRTLAFRWNLHGTFFIPTRWAIQTELVYTLRPTLSSACAAHIRFWCSRSHSCVDCLLVKSSPVWQRPDTVQLTTLCLTGTPEVEGTRARAHQVSSSSWGDSRAISFCRSDLCRRVDDIAHCRSLGASSSSIHPRVQVPAAEGKGGIWLTTS